VEDERVIPIDRDVDIVTARQAGRELAMKAGDFRNRL